VQVQGVRRERSHSCVTDEQPVVREAHGTAGGAAATDRVDAEGREGRMCVPRP
jgi:hypothetical protein